jgi:uncharacterized protein (DUF1697 family)
MKTYIALFRAINVGGRNLLPMPALRLLLEKQQCDGVQTYIQSGNAIFRSAQSAPDLARRIGSAVKKGHGFEPRVLLLSADDLERAAARNPFPQAAANPKSLHLFFLDDVPKKPDVKGLEALKADAESFVLDGRVFYLFSPAFGTSKLAARVEQLLGVEGTARNWRTVTTLLDMVKG